MALSDFEAFLATPGQKTDAEVVAAMARTGVGAADVARLTSLPVEEVQQRINAVAPPAPELYTNPNPTFQEFGRFLGTPGVTDAQVVAEMRRLGVTPEQVSSITNIPVEQISSRMTAATPVVKPPVAPPVVKPPVQNQQTQFQNFLRTPGLTDADILAEMNRAGVSAQQVADMANLPLNQVQNRISNLLPFSNATQGFEQQFRNYTSVPIGAQYNPNVTGGLSPYGQIMSQMQPLTNPYATARSGLAMGGYDPNIYDKNLLNNFVQKRAAELALASAGTPTDVSGGGDSGIGGGDTGAGGGFSGMSNSGEGGPGSDAGWYKGGLIDRVSGSKPNSPDDGQINAQVGEYVVKKSSVDKYGKGLLDMINEGKIPAKKIKSLLD